MQPQEKVGVCDVADFVHGLHVPHITIKRVPHLSKARRHRPNFAARISRVVHRHVTEEENARALQLRDGAQEAARRGKLLIGHFKIRAGGREQRSGGRPERDGDIIVERVQRRGARVGSQERARDERVVSVCACPGDVYAVVGHVDAFGGDGGGYVGGAVQLLLG